MDAVMVTGGAGFIGSRFVQMLMHERPETRVVVVDSLTYAGSLDNLSEAAESDRFAFERVDVCDQAALEQVFYEYQPALVVHFAAETHVDNSIANPDAFVRTNVQGTVSLLRACGSLGWEKVRMVHVSTDEVYGARALDGCDRPPFSEGDALRPRSPYAASKAAAEQFVAAFSETFGARVTTVRCCNVFGPHQFGEKLIPLCIDRAVRHEEIPLYGDGRNMREWLYVDDACAGILAAAERDADGAVYNIGSGFELSNRQVIERVLREVRLAASDSSIDWSLVRVASDRLGHDARYGVDCSRIRALGWSPARSFDEGLRQTVKERLARL